MFAGNAFNWERPHPAGETVARKFPAMKIVG
jgi:hypothetical protein